jgi:hypothetical protein
MRTSTEITIRLTAGRFYLEPPHDIKWFRSIRNFSPGWYAAAVGEASLSVPRFGIQLFSGIHETPFGTARIWIRAENRITAGAFRLNTAYFATDSFLIHRKTDPIICAGSTMLHTAAQLKVSPEYTWLLSDRPDRIFRTGLCFLTESLQETSYTAENYSKNGIGVNVESVYGSTTIRFTAAAKNIPFVLPGQNLPESGTEHDFTAGIAHSFRDCRISETFSLTVSQQNKKRYAESLHIYFRQIKPFRTAVTFSTSLSEHRCRLQTGTTAASVMCSYACRQMRYTGKITLTASF